MHGVLKATKGVVNLKGRDRSHNQARSLILEFRREKSRMEAFFLHLSLNFECCERDLALFPAPAKLALLAVFLFCFVHKRREFGTRLKEGLLY